MEKDVLQEATQKILNKEASLVGIMLNQNKEVVQHLDSAIKILLEIQKRHTGNEALNKSLILAQKSKKRFLESINN